MSGKPLPADEADRAHAARVFKRVRERQTRDFLDAVRRERDARTDDEVAEAYRRAMAEKGAR